MAENETTEGRQPQRHHAAPIRAERFAASAPTEGECWGCSRTTHLYVELWPNDVRQRHGGAQVLLGCEACGRTRWLTADEVPLFVDDAERLAAIRSVSHPDGGVHTPASGEADPTRRPPAEWPCPVCHAAKRWGTASCEGPVGGPRHAEVFLSNLYADAATPAAPVGDEEDDGWRHGPEVRPPASGDYPWPHHSRCQYIATSGYGWCTCHSPASAPVGMTEGERARLRRNNETLHAQLLHETMKREGLERELAALRATAADLPASGLVDELVAALVPLSAPNVNLPDDVPDSCLQFYAEAAYRGGDRLYGPADIDAGQVRRARRAILAAQQHTRPHLTAEERAAGEQLVDVIGRHVGAMDHVQAQEVWDAMRRFCAQVRAQRDRIEEALDKAPHCARVVHDAIMRGDEDAPVTPQGATYAVEKLLLVLVRDTLGEVDVPDDQQHRPDGRGWCFECGDEWGPNDANGPCPGRRPAPSPPESREVPATYSVTPKEDRDA